MGYSDRGKIHEANHTMSIHGSNRGFHCVYRPMLPPKSTGASRVWHRLRRCCLQINNAQTDRARSEVWGQMTRRVTSAPHWPLLAPYMTDITQPNWRIPPYSMRQSPHGCVPGCKEYNSNISIKGRKIQGVPDNGKDRLLSTNAQNRLFSEQWQFIAMF